ncbi:unnamed protein product [Musa acuminata subsp. malaccensis]|uniref:(wild Malaysian banana) hypothetical protein n=1 Tax=Musa acuminata subsp. malaccensis TaxID=214687 RepID=A0A804IR50_MUSAM|nr:PREDICTED: uncharacterized protein LOC103981951 [Musa acuminata subsp. malaccensis]CAG1842662.1 unnamed protein product [Musa acuminata subsp. malaccensis]
MAYERRQSSVCAAFTLSPLPYHVLLILLMVLGLLSLSWFFHYESFIDDAEEQMSWALLVIPVLLILVIRWLSSIERLDDSLLGLFSYDHRRRIYYNGSNERPQVGSSPWGVAAVVVLLLILVYFQSSFQDMWGP